MFQRAPHGIDVAFVRWMKKRAWVLLAGLSACLLPPPIEEGNTVQNQPPRILPELLTPDPTEGPWIMSTLCNEYRLFASLTDPDRGDTLYWRVFVNYHRDELVLSTEIHTEPPNESNPGAPRPINFLIFPNDSRFGETDARYSEPHSVEIFLSDRAIFENSRNPKARALPEDGLSDSFIWPVGLTNTNDPGCVSGP